MDCSEDVDRLKQFVDKDRVYKFLIGLNQEFDKVKVQTSGKVFGYTW